MKRLILLAVAAALAACTCDNTKMSPITTTQQSATAPASTPATMTTPMAMTAPMKMTAPATMSASTAATAPAANLQVWVDDLDLTKATQGYNETYKNESAEHNPVTLKGKTFAHAVGTHANGLIVIDLKGAAKSFSVTVGIDDDAEDEGSCGFTVIADGKVLARTGTINRQDPVKKLSVDLTGAKQLVLQCDSGDDDNINNDHADWAEPLITLDPAKASAHIETVAASLAKMPAQQ